MFDLLKYFGIKECYKIPQALLECLLDNTRKEKLFNDFLLENKDLSKAFFTNEFQTEHGDRDNFKQDFTPLNICKLTALLGGKAEKIADLCAGIGGLTVACWNFNPYSFYFCVEKTERAIPFLLFNLAIRNINGIVVLGDVLTLDTSNQERIFKLTPSYNFSEIEEINGYTLDEFDLILSNPPYSLKWQPFGNQAFKYGIAPSKACDYSFIQIGLSLLNENGKMVFILPHGVLFRGQSEGKIRKGIIEDNLISAVIGIADNCFLNTAIPVCLIEFDKNKTDKNILFVDASKECKKVGKINVLNDEHVNKIFDAVKSRKDIERFSSLASFETIQQNDYNLNIPRYVDTFIKQELPPLTETLNELFEIDNQIKETSERLANDVLSLKGFNKEEKEAVEKWAKILKSGVL